MTSYWLDVSAMTSFHDVACSHSLAMTGHLLTNDKEIPLSNVKKIRRDLREIIGNV